MPRVWVLLPTVSPQCSAWSDYGLILNCPRIWVCSMNLTTFAATLRSLNNARSLRCPGNWPNSLFRSAVCFLH
ncbi:hypothetical protein EDB81DRAFT_834861 [Dactylonectria macrodidyma]|uniref:Uncharacterized protein n=1 Tax=Dactylonectria macrodidyma TaxID=307937 RepID=A0A9P9I782_9HYPO|nr:hypothetical protein EDB81DRAFT_834861 [Dactylonectria macrodidyma]